MRYKLEIKLALSKITYNRQDNAHQRLFIAKIIKKLMMILI